MKIEENYFEGLWKLLIAEYENPESGQWEAWNGGLQGYLLYDNKDNVAVHMMPREYQDTDIEFHLLPEKMTLDVAGHYSRPDIFTLHVDTSPQNNVDWKDGS